MRIPPPASKRTTQNGTNPMCWPSWLTLLLGLVLTALAMVYTKNGVDAETSAELALTAREVAAKVEKRLQAHALVLRSTSAFFESSNIVTREEFRLFVRQLLLDKNLPGLQGVGFAVKIPAGHLDEHIRAIRREGFPDYHVWPQNERDVYTSIVFLEPFSGRNLRAFGYDMSTEPVRWEAMARARDKDVAALSGKVLLVQETNEDVQAGVLMYVPVYSQKMPDQTESERRVNLVGWAYSPFRMNDLMQGILGEREMQWGKPVGLRVYDGYRIDAQSLLYEGNLTPDGASRESDTQDGRLIPVDFNGHRWTLAFNWASPPLLSKVYAKVWLVSCGGSTIALLLSLLVFNLSKTRSIARQLSVELAAHKQADQDLQASLESLRQERDTTHNILQTVDAVIVALDKEGGITLVNRKGSELLGYSELELLGRNWFSTCLPECPATDEAREYLSHHLLEDFQGFEYYENPVLTRLGEQRLIAWHNSLIRDAQGEVVGILGVGEDITQRKQAEQALHVALTKYKTLFDSFPLGITISDEKGSIIEANPVADKLLGLALDEQLGRTIDSDSWQIVRSDGSPMPAEEYASVRAIREKRVVANVEMGIVKPGGQITWIIVTATPLPLDGYGVAITYGDITERKLMLDALRVSEQRFHLMFEKHDSVMLLVEPVSGAILDANQAASTFYGYSQSELRRRSINDINPLPPGEIAEVCRKIAMEEQNCFEFTHRLASGEMRAVEVHSSPITVQGKDALFSIIHDISERKRAESELECHREHLEELVRARTLELIEAREVAEAASRAKSVFLANMSHEIRTPMNAIIGLTHILQKQISDPKPHDQLLKVGNAAQNLLRIINDILDLSKIESGRLNLEQSDFSLADVIEEILNMNRERAQSKGLCLAKLIDPALPGKLKGDSLRVGQILLNYIGNAVKFSERGQITVRAILLEKDESSVLIRMEVDDQGIGVEKDQQGRLFQSFTQADDSTTRKYGGTGLGLAIAKRLAELMGGQVGFSSRPGLGSIFWATARFGRAKEDTAISDRHESRMNWEYLQCLQGRRLLLVEDEPVNQEVARELLEEAGLDVVTADNGMQAVEQVLSEDFDLVLMDMQMPVMNGLEATRAIRQMPGKSTLPIIAMTANAFEEDRRHCLEVGMNDHIGKPVDPAVLYRILLRWLPAPQVQVPNIPERPLG